ncbi:RNA methyltransferase [uncultured Treponema sp.]|uniref:RNA methyltransferase n=1 Tax=uncultured Treponema sp. TaxID=162155 RepID=UPI0025DDF2F9|nr:RNA methyltransferase [uncultured Treponema sp.]
MNLSNVVIILCRPEESRNVGAVCRAMANNGLKNLRIVGKKSDFDEERVRILAIHAASIWENAEFFDSITAASKDCVLCAGTTRRRGKKRGKLLLPEELAESVSPITQDGKIAVVFGNERTGLEEQELDECTMGVTIPSDEGFPSLNLSHAVQLVSYQIFRKSLEEKNKISAGYTPVTLERLDKTVTGIADNLQKIGFFKVTGRSDMEKFWTDVLSRAALSESEAQYIEKVFSKAAGLASKHAL